MHSGAAEVGNHYWVRSAAESASAFRMPHDLGRMAWRGLGILQKPLIPVGSTAGE